MEIRDHQTKKEKKRTLIPSSTLIHEAEVHFNLKESSIIRDNIAMRHIEVRMIRVVSTRKNIDLIHPEEMNKRVNNKDQGLVVRTEERILSTLKLVMPVSVRYVDPSYRIF